MLKIVEGGFYSVARDEMKKEILRLTNEKRRVFLLVPEQEALSTERELAQLLPSFAPLYFEVTNFTRLADTVFRRFGGISAEYSDKKRDALIMWKALTELAPTLAITDGRAEVSYGLVEKALRAYGEMRSLSLEPQKLESLAQDERIKEKRLKAKLSDLSKIITLYKKLHSERFCDSADNAQLLFKKLSAHGDFLSDTEIFIDGFTSFTEPQYQIISALVKATRVSIFLPISPATEDAFEFAEIKDTKSRLLSISCGGEVKLERKSALSQSKSSTLYEASSLMWHTFGTMDKDTEIGYAIRIFEATDPYEECDFIAADVKRRIMQGAKPRDFAIVAHDVDKYVGLIDVSLDNASLPYFISKKKDVSSFEAIKLIYAAMRVIDTGFERESVVSYMKCGLSGISREACDNFELYLEKWQINGSRFTDGIFWNMHPDGYTDRRGDEVGEALLLINETREALTTPLLRYKEERASAKTVREHARALFDFLSRLSLEEKIRERCEELKRLGESEAAEDSTGLWKIICDSLDVLVDTLGDMSIDALGFEQQLKVVISMTDIGRIPAHYDEITVGSAAMIRLRDKKHVYLIGVNSGEFPATPKDNSFFTERDKLELGEIEEKIKPEGEIAYARELFSFTRAFSAASESVTLFYSQRDVSFSSTLPADVIKRICELTDKRVSVKRICELPLEEKLYFPAAALEALNTKSRDAVCEALIGAGYSREISISQKDIRNASLSLGRDVTSLIYRGALALTQSKIDQYVSCPLSYYLRYDLHLSEEERAEFDARNIGTFIHSILENFFGEIRTPEELSAMTGEDRESLVRRCAAGFLRSVSEEDIYTNRRLAIQLNRLTDAALPIVEGLCEELAGCKFVPKYFELKIDSKNEKLPSSATFTAEDGTPVYIKGIIDRVDTYKHDGNVYVRVIDYKTGAKTFSPTDLDEGKNLQMFLYLKSIIDTKDKDFRKDIGVSEDGELIPAGVIYVKTDLSDVKIPHRDRELATAQVKKNQERRGMILDDPESIGAMNSAYIPVRFTKSGAPDSRYAKYLYTREVWDEMMDKIAAKVSDVSSAMKRGEIGITKNTKEKDSPCTYCKFKPICRSKT